MLSKRATDEETGLIRQAKPYGEIVKERAKRAALFAPKFTLALGGASASALYYAPSKVCVLEATCGKPVADFLTLMFSDYIAYLLARLGYLISGGASYALVNALLAAKSVDEVIELFTADITIAGITTRVILIPIYVASQIFSSILAARATSESTLQTVMIVGGNVPPAFYTAMQLAKQLPIILSMASGPLMTIRQKYQDCFTTVEAAAIAQREKDNFYFASHKEFLQSVKNRKENLIGRLSELKNDGSLPYYIDKDPAEFLFSQHVRDELIKRGYGMKTAYMLAGAASIPLAGVFNNPFVQIKMNMLKQLMPGLAALVVASYLSSSLLWTNGELLMKLMINIVEIIECTFTDKHIQSPAFQLHPYITSIAVVGIVLFSTLSYALMNELSMLVAPNNSAKDQALRYTANVSMGLYHVIGMAILLERAMKFVTSQLDPKVEFLYKAIDAADKLEKTTLKDYINLAESNELSPDANEEIKGLAAKKALFGITKFSLFNQPVQDGALRMNSLSSVGIGSNIQDDYLKKNGLSNITTDDKEKYFGTERGSHLSYGATQNKP